MRDPLHTLISDRVWRAAERWIYISMSGYILDAGVRDLSPHNQQRIQANIFIQPSKCPVLPNICAATVRSM